MPANLIFRLLRKGKIRVDGGRVKQNYRIVGGEELKLPAITVAAQQKVNVPAAFAEQIAKSIIHEDDDLLVLNKASGHAVHGGTDVQVGVIEALRHLFPELPDIELVHRIDRETSGLLLVAKNPATLRHLQEVLRDREADIKRRYLALVDGYWPEDLTVSHTPLRRTSRATLARPDGDRAETRFRVVQRFGQEATLVEARLLTGRKHQIRVHCQDAGHPIGGDARYGNPGFNQVVAGHGVRGMMLHAYQLEVPVPDGQVLEFEAAPPKGWAKYPGLKSFS